MTSCGRSQDGKSNDNPRYYSIHSLSVRATVVFSPHLSPPSSTFDPRARVIPLHFSLVLSTHIYPYMHVLSILPLFPADQIYKLFLQIRRAASRSSVDTGPFFTHPPFLQPFYFHSTAPFPHLLEVNPLFIFRPIAVSFSLYFLMRYSGIMCR